MVAFLVTCVCVALLVAGGVVISVRLCNRSYQGQRLGGSRRVYAALRRYATDTNVRLADVDMVYSSRWKTRPCSGVSGGMCSLGAEQSRQGHPFPRSTSIPHEYQCWSIAPPCQLPKATD